MRKFIILAGVIALPLLWIGCAGKEKEEAARHE